MLALVVILLLLLGWALIAGRLARYSVTAPLALLVTGVVLTAGWARPRGIASVVFGLLAYIELTGPDADLVLAVMVVTVVASIVVHGLSAGPVARR